jgi:hypothetical protein
LSGAVRRRASRPTSATGATKPSSRVTWPVRPAGHLVRLDHPFDKNELGTAVALRRRAGNASRRCPAGASRAASASKRSTRNCREYPLIKDFCYKLNIHVACARRKFSPLPHFGHRLCNANHLGFRRYPKVRLDHLPGGSSAYVSPVRAQWGARSRSRRRPAPLVRLRDKLLDWAPAVLPRLSGTPCMLRM